MGGGHWSSEFYAHREKEREKAGRSTFAYHDTVSKQAPDARKVHASLDPKDVLIRESRDSAEHPESTAVMIFFDVTGSMRDVPVTLQQKLPNLMDTLNDGAFIPHPQLFFGAIGDEYSDKGPLQVGQFESDNRVNDAFENMWLEGKGGGSMEESYQNAFYFAARHTSIDCWEKRKKKGYLILIGDELPYKVVSRAKLGALLGTDIQQNIPVEDIIKEAQEKFHTFFIIPTLTNNGRNPAIRKRWSELLGAQNVLLLDDANSVCETIALVIGLCEGSSSLDAARTTLEKNGSSISNINAATSAVSSISSTDGQRTTRL